MELYKRDDGGCLAWAVVFASFMVSFLQVAELLRQGENRPELTSNMNVSDSRGKD